MENNPNLDGVVVAAIDRTISQLFKKRFIIDPLLDEKESRLTSLNSAAAKRHGSIIELAIRRAIELTDRFVVWRESDFWISSNADSLSGNKTLPEDIFKTRLPYRTPSPADRPDTRWSRCQVDLLAFEFATGRLSALEIKRGNSWHDSGKDRDILRRQQCVSMLLHSYGEYKGYNITETSSRCVYFYGRGHFPIKEFVLNGRDLNESFGVEIYDFVERHTEYLKLKFNLAKDAL